MKIRTSSHPFTLNGLKMPSGVAYVNDASGKFVFNSCHVFTRGRKLIQGFVFYPEKWSRMRTDNSGRIDYLYHGQWIKAAFSFTSQFFAKIWDKMAATKNAVRTPAVSARIDSERLTRQIERDADIPRERRVVAEYVPFDGTAYSLRKINNSGDDNPLFNQRVVDEAVSLLARPHSTGGRVKKATAETARKPVIVGDELDTVSVWIRDNCSRYVRNHCARNIKNWAYAYKDKLGLAALTQYGLNDAEIILADCLDNFVD